MHRSSESIASLAAALAKAQMTLTNPEKSLTATVRIDRRDDSGRTFRYAPLSSGLDIVRKALGQHEIATLQTTTIDQDIQTVSLTTVLAHSSGEWIASDWPVCMLSDMTAPRRMGAALTYARRYALFTLVGIAGEDDLDAPDVGGQSVSESKVKNRKANGNVTNEPLGRFATKRKAWSPPKQALGPDKSAALRDRLLRELTAIADGDEATAWTLRSLAAKNMLTASDAALVEAEFTSRMAGLTGSRSAEAPLSLRQGAGEKEATPAETPEPSGRAALMAALRASVEVGTAEEAGRPSAPSGGVQAEPVNNAVVWHIDKSALTLSEPRRYRDRAHLEFVSAQPCLLCGRRPSDAHHLKYRVSDEFAVPLCRTHHRALHRRGDEPAWWQSVNIDPAIVAQRLWQQSRLNGAPVRRNIGTLMSAPVVRDSEDGRIQPPAGPADR